MKRSVLVLLSTCVLFCFSDCSKNKKVSCSDGLKNQGEILTDCGGPCSPCETCSDGILNQDETATDCGGVCSKCGTCYDGIQNQGEAGVDCGGPCGICGVYYSESGSCGYNILHNDTVSHFINSNPSFDQYAYFTFYSLRCRVQEGIKVKIVFTKLSGTGTWGSTTNNWFMPYNNSANSPANFYREFSAVGEITAEACFYFTQEGSAKMQIFEEDMNTPVREKIIYWNPPK